jgi:hypothetical protein
MPALEMLSRLMNNEPLKLSREENLILEAELFARICENLKENIKIENKAYFKILKLNMVKENDMLDKDLIRCVVNDILSTNEYTVSGVACYTNTHEDVIFEIASGTISSPSVTIFRKIIELHRSVRKDLYQSIMNKVISSYSSQESTV